MRYLAKSALAAAAVVFWSVPGKTAELSWPSFMWGEPNNKPFLTELKKTFETENPGHTIKDITIPIAAFWDKQFADVSSGNPGDIATMFDPEMRVYVEAGLLEPLDSYLTAAGVKASEFIPTASLAQKDGKIYAVPYQINARALFYNEKLLKEAGVSAPRNVDEFLNAARKMRKPEIQQFGYATLSKPGAGALAYIELMPIVTGFGGGFFRNGQPSANAPETVAALKFIKTVYDEQLIPRGMDAPTYRNFFAQGKVGMYASGAFMAAVTKAGSQEVYSHLRAVPLPLPSGKSMSITVFMGIPKGAKNKDLAAKLLVRLLSDEMQQKLVVLGTTIPGRVGMIPASFVQENPWFVAFQEAAKTAKSYAPEGAEQYGAEIIKIVTEHVEGMLFNNVSAEDTGNKLQKALTEFIATKKKT